VSYQEKKTITSILAGLLVIILYCIYGFTKYNEMGAELLNDLSFWSKAMLVTMGGGIVLMIIIQIVFHILLAVANEVAKEVAKETAKKTDCTDKSTFFEEMEISGLEDEMDRLIALISLRNGYVVISIGFVTALATLYFKMPPAIMLNVMFLSFFVGSLLEAFTQLYLYRRGVHNG
jgi:hypothetical protein